MPFEDSHWRNALCLHTCNSSFLLESVPGWLQKGWTALGAKLDRQVGWADSGNAALDSSVGPGCVAVVDIPTVLGCATDTLAAENLDPGNSGGECCCLMKSC